MTLHSICAQLLQDRHERRLNTNIFFYEIPENVIQIIFSQCDRKSFLSLLLLSKEWNQKNLSQIHQFLKNSYLIITQKKLPSSVCIPQILDQCCIESPDPTITHVKKLDLLLARKISELFIKELPSFEGSNMTIPKILENLKASNQYRYPDRLIQAIIYHTFNQLNSKSTTETENHEKLVQAFQALQLDSRLYLNEPNHSKNEKALGNV